MARPTGVRNWPITGMDEQGLAAWLDMFSVRSDLRKCRNEILGSEILAVLGVIREEDGALVAYVCPDKGATERVLDMMGKGATIQWREVESWRIIPYCPLV